MRMLLWYFAYIPSPLLYIHCSFSVFYGKTFQVEQLRVTDVFSDKKKSLEKCLNEKKELTALVKEELQTVSVSLSPSLRMMNNTVVCHHILRLLHYLLCSLLFHLHMSTEE